MVASPSPSPTPPRPSGPIEFTDVTSEAGIRFKHNSGAFGKKFLPETIGAGGAFASGAASGWLAQPASSDETNARSSVPRLRRFPLNSFTIPSRLFQSRRLVRHRLAASSIDTTDDPIQNQMTGPKS